MSTVLYNIETGKVTAKFPNGYTVDGKPGIVELPLIELEVINNSVPEFDAETHYCLSQIVVDLESKTYSHTWEVVAKTAISIALEGWHHPQFEKRIIAPIELVMQYPQMEIWFRINNLPIVKEGNTLYCYCNVILEAHSQLVDSLQGIVSIETRPDLL